MDKKRFPAGQAGIGIANNRPPAGKEGALGIYVHVPFCAGEKCPYCDFYSLKFDESAADKYTAAVERDIIRWGQRARGRCVDTVYFGGGTPYLLGERLERLLNLIKRNFSVFSDAEVTFEANPSDIKYERLVKLRKAGFNRISIGMQSANNPELAALGRRHRKNDVEAAVFAARKADFSNISLDIMLCTPLQTPESLLRSIDFAAALSPEHISAYLLKVEPGTKYFAAREKLALPDDDKQADIYTLACKRLVEKGFIQYEISNFSKKGFEARHNLKYWDCGEYLGFGPAAHSYYNGARFYYPRSLSYYIEGKPPVDDGAGGTLEEYVMLRLRLAAGLRKDELERRYGRDFSFFDSSLIDNLAKGGFLFKSEKRIFLTRKGFLVSNSIISDLLFR